MFLIVCYDIASDRRRVKVQKAMEDYGARVQFSVFECDLERPDLLRLQQRLRKLIDPKRDSVRFYSLCEGDVKKTEVLGLGKVKRPAPYQMV